MARKSKGPKEPKRPVGITPEFESEMSSASTEDLKSRIVTLQQQLDESQTDLKEKQEIKDLREELKMTEGPYRDTIKSLKNRTKFIIEALKGRGVTLKGQGVA